MGIAERRIQQEFLETRIPEAMSKLAEATGDATKAVKCEFDWESMIENKTALDNLWSTWEQPLGAVQDICNDSIGKEAIKKGLKKIVLTNVKTNDEVKVTFAQGTLTVAMNFQGGSSGTPGWTEIKKI